MYTAGKCMAKTRQIAGNPWPAEQVELGTLRAHPRNYREHPADQLAHIRASLREHGQYRNVVIAREGTILAGHGVVQGMLAEGWSHGSVIRLPIDPDSVQALKVLTGDNEMSKLAEVDDATFLALLTEVQSMDNLLGTGYDEMMLSNLQYVTSPPMPEQDAEQEWAEAGMPEHDAGKEPFKLVVSFRSEDDRARFTAASGLAPRQYNKRVWVTWWPPADQQDLVSLKLERETPAVCNQ